MRGVKVSVIALCAGILGSSQLTIAAVLSFEEIHGTNTGTFVPFTNYGGLLWGGVLAARISGVAGSGGVTGIVDGITGAMNTLGPDIHVSASPTTTFTSNGAYFTAYANNTQPIDFYGYRPGDDPWGTGPSGIGTPTFFDTITADTAGATGTRDPPTSPSPQFYTIDFTDIEDLVILGHDGADSLFGGADGTNSYIIDLFTYNESVAIPAPPPLAAGAGVMAIMSLRRRIAQHG